MLTPVKVYIKKGIGLWAEWVLSNTVEENIKKKTNLIMDVFWYEVQVSQLK